jgi:hypothetical protein
MKTKVIVIFLLFLIMVLDISCKRSSPLSSKPGPELVVQLNWYHDPTFVGEYLLQKEGTQVAIIREGGPNIQPISEILGRRAHIAVLGADIFLQAIDEELKRGQEPQIVCIFIDLQRNPVGWVLHPDGAKSAGFDYNDFIKNPKRQNVKLFDLLKKGELKVGDKRGTETTSIWIQWAKVHDPDSQITVLPVGFDSAVVLSAPKLLYPVYLNEEPFKLGAKIGRPVFVFDPAIDGVSMYGNVIICAKEFAEQNPMIVSQIQTDLRRCWEKVRNDPNSMVGIVAQVYTGVSKDVIRKQIEKTVEFVYYNSSDAGEMDLKPNGKWDKTLKALQAANLVSENLILDKLNKYVIPPK